MWRRILGWWRRDVEDPDLDEEIRAHLAIEARERVQSGESAEDAEAAARRVFGNTTLIREEIYQMGALTLMNYLGRDIRYSLRRLRFSLGFTCIAIATLAIGIGATTAIFSVVYSVLIKPLPYPNPHELVSIRPSAPGVNVSDLTSDPTMLLAYSAENRVFASIGLWDRRFATLTIGGTATRVPALRVTNGMLQALGVQPTRGRWFTKQEELGPPAEGQQSVILSYAFWQQRFGGDEGVLGREISMEAPSNSTSFPFAGQWRVVGIMPRGFRFLDWTPQPDVIIPLRLDPARERISNFSFSMLARLKPGVTPAMAGADLDRMVPIWLSAWPTVPGSSLTREVIEKNWRITSVVRPLKDDLVGGIASTLWVLMGAIGAVLLIACANIANLMLVRAEARQQEFAVRAALGAGNLRIAGELLVESLCLGIAGSLLGLLFAYVGVRVLVENGPSNLPRLQEVSIEPAVLVFTGAISLASAVVFGSITALKHLLNAEASRPLAVRGTSASRERSATRSALVVVQVALSLVLVVSAALMIRTFQALRHVDAGFSDPATIQTARTWIPSSLHYDPVQGTRAQREILDRISTLPGVTSLGFAIDVPMGEFRGNGGVWAEGDTIAAGTSRGVRLNYVSPGYFEAMGTRIVTGRDMTWNDIETGGRVALISEDFARELAGESGTAVGKRIRTAIEGSGWHEVIGVVQSVYQDGLYEGPPRMVYWPVLVANRFGQSGVTFAIRSERAGTASFVDEVRQAIWSVKRNIPVAQERTMQDFYAGTLARTSFTLVMLTIAGAMALTLGIIGIYGVIAYLVSQRTREIGIRLALGAEPKQVKKIFVRHGLALGTVGAIVGFAGAAALGRLMSSLLFGIGPMDPVAYVTALGVILAAAALASYLPAHRAAKIDPMEALRVD